MNTRKIVILFDWIREFFFRKEYLLLTEVNQVFYFHEIALLSTDDYNKLIRFAQEECTEEQMETMITIATQTILMIDQ